MTDVGFVDRVIPLAGWYKSPPAPKLALSIFPTSLACGGVVQTRRESKAFSVGGSTTAVALSPPRTMSLL